MPSPSIPDLLLGLNVGRAEPAGGNRVACEGVTWTSQPDGTLELGIRKLEAASLRLASGPLVLEVGQLVLHQVKARVRVDAGRPRLDALEAASAELAGVKVHGPVALAAPAGASPASAWSLVPLAAANGTLRAEIVDAHLLFDADVTVPIRQGEVNFNEATVEHVGPDSRMGVSRLGLFVDAPNGRSYLYQFAATPVAGVQFERPGVLPGPGPWGGDRGKLRLQEFLEGLLRQGGFGHGPGFTDQSRLLFERTAVSGEVRLGDGRLAAPGVQADLAGRAEGRNTVRVHSGSVGRGLSLAMDALSVRDAVLGAMGLQLACSEVTGALTLRLALEGAQLRFTIELASVKVSGVRGDRSPVTA